MSSREIMNAQGFYDKKENQFLMIDFRDPVVKRVVQKFADRSDAGFIKYGTTLHEERTTKMKGLLKYIIDIQEELVDAILYLQTAQEELKEQLDEKKT